MNTGVVVPGNQFTKYCGYENTFFIFCEMCMVQGLLFFLFAGMQSFMCPGTSNPQRGTRPGAGFCL